MKYVKELAENMARLPQPGKDSGAWGQILNDYLGVEHNADGTLKSSGSIASKANSADVVSKAANLSDLASISTARSNLGLGDAATKSVGTAVGTVAAGNDTRITGAVQHGELVFNVKDYGATGNGTTNDTTAIQAALDAVPTAGGILYFPAGNYLVPNGGLTRNAPITIIGAGSGSYVEGGGSRIICTSATATLLTFSTPGIALKGLAFVNQSGTRPTAGNAILATHFDHSRIEQCMFAGFWTQLRVTGGYFYIVRDTAFLRPVEYGAHMANSLSGQHDYGDQVFEGCYFSKYGDSVNGATAVRWESGGGLRMTSCKVNAGPFPEYPSGGFWTNGFTAHMSPGGTSVHVITGCSIEGWTGDGIKFTGSASASFGKISITGNEFLASGSGGACITLDGTNMTSLDNVVITGNVGYGAGGGVTLRSILSAVVVGNNWANCLLGAINVTRVKDLVQRDNLWKSSVNDFGNYLAADGQVRGPWTYAHEVAGFTTTAFYGKITPASYTEGIVTVKVYGNIATLGGFRLEQRRVISRAAGNPTMGATVGTDLAIGPGAGELTISYDTGALPGIRPTLTSATGKAFTGVVEVSFDGKMTAISYNG